jgi:hypothetical protein
MLVLDDAFALGRVYVYVKFTRTRSCGESQAKLVMEEQGKDKGKKEGRCDSGIEVCKGVACRHASDEEAQTGRGDDIQLSVSRKGKQTVEYQEKQALWYCMVRVQNSRVVK